MNRLYFLVVVVCAGFSSNTQHVFAEIDRSKDHMVISEAVLEEFGIYRTTEEATANAPGTSTGEITLLENPSLLRSTTIIPALTRSSFGIRYRVKGRPDGHPVQVREVVVTPGISNPSAKGPLRYQEINPNITRVGQLTYMGYRFDQAWEAVPGKWKFEVWHDDHLLLRKEFEVVQMELRL